MDRSYFDHNATTPVSPEVMAAIVPIMTEAYGNASSIHHYGQSARTHLDSARRHVAALLHATPEEIVFTSGGTESDNLAILGLAPAHVITTTVEHPAILNTVAKLPSVTHVPVNHRGVIDPSDIQRAIRPDTKLITIMHANNELGTLQPLAEIAKIAQHAGILFHSDGVQAAAKIPVNVNALSVDLYSISGHKFGAPKGIGALYVRKGTHLSAILHGGHHERDRRAGTENVPGAVGIGRAAQWFLQHGAAESARQENLRDRLEHAVLARIPGVHINGAHAARVPNTSNLRFEGIDSEPLLIALDLRGFAVSSGSACSSGASEPSHVLAALGLTKEQSRSSLRISLGRTNDDAQVDALVEALVASVAHLRKLAPAYA